MKKFKPLVLALTLMLSAVNFAAADVRIGLHLDLFPDLEPIPGYPVYYAPRVQGNFFFYDGAYWLYEDDGWYVSDWYDGPWDYVDPEFVPVFLLRIPLRYYRVPPPYFWGWHRDEPPRWGHYWGPGWERNHRDWDRWDRSYVPRRAPLPTYQREFRGDRYPDRDRQRELRDRNYNYRSLNNDRPQDQHRDNYRGSPERNRPDSDRRDDWQPNQPFNGGRENNRDRDTNQERDNKGWQRGDDRKPDNRVPEGRGSENRPQGRPDLNDDKRNENRGGFRGGNNDNGGERRDMAPSQQRENITPRYSMPEQRERPGPAVQEIRGGWQQSQPDRERGEDRGGWQRRSEPAAVRVEQPRSQFQPQPQQQMPERQNVEPRGGRGQPQQTERGADQGQGRGSGNDGGGEHGRGGWRNN